MTSWADVRAAAPELGARAEALFEGPGLILLGTTRRDGWPRITPVEHLFHAGDLWLGMMPNSRKALDLLRDPRCLIHNVVSGTDGIEGEIKLRGRTQVVSNADQRRAFEDALEAKIDWRPEPPYHLFRIDVVDIAYVYRRGEVQHIERWPGRPHPVRREVRLSQSAGRRKTNGDARAVSVPAHPEPLEGRAGCARVVGN